MSVLARRHREQEEARHRALLGLRDSVIAAVTRQAPEVGSVAIEEAVEAALARVLEEGAHRCGPALVRNWWIKWARESLFAQGRGPAFRQRDRVPVDQHPRALALGARDDALEFLEDDLTTTLVREILAALRGPQREWAQALFAQLLREGDGDGEGEPLPGLGDVLGWSAEKTKKTGQRACATMTAFINDRATGKVCSRRQAVLSTYITATEGHAGAQPGDADRRKFEAVASHLAGCPECYVAWRRRRSTLLERCGALIMVPLDSLAAAGQALAGLFSGAQNATLSLLARLGLGSGAAAAGGSAAAISTKTAAVCVGLVCAAGAGVGEITGVLPPISAPKTKTVPVKTHQATARQTQTPAPVATPAVARRSVRPMPPPPPPAPPPPRRAAKTSSASATASSSTPSSTRATSPTRSTSPRFTPGDLPLSPSPPPPPLPPPAASSGSGTPSSPRCVPGSLGC